MKPSPRGLTCPRCQSDRVVCDGRMVDDNDMELYEVGFCAACGLPLQYDAAHDAVVPALPSAVIPISVQRVRSVVE